MIRRLKSIPLLGLLLAVVLVGCRDDQVTAPQDEALLLRAGELQSTRDVPGDRYAVPNYVRGPVSPHQTGIVRVYQDEQPWFGTNRAHASLINIGKQLGVDYFIHPLLDLQAPGGIPAGTELVVITSNSLGQAIQAERQNHPAAQANLANFLRAGGKLIVDMGDNLPDGGFIAPGAVGTPALIFPDNPCDRGFIQDPSHPLFSAFHTLTNDDVSHAPGFCSVAHGNLEQGIALPPDAVGLITATFPPVQRLILAEYCFEDVGRVILDTMTKEFAAFPPVGTGPSRFMDNLFAYGLSANADCGPVQVVPVDIHDAYSGDPRRDPGIIHLEDDWVYVEIIDPLSYRPTGAVGGTIPFQSADDVRIGDDWETGVPAESFTLPHIGGDPAQRDFRGRWVLQQLRDAGHLPLGPTTLDVWGRDDDGNEYHGQIEVEVIDNGPPIVACSHDNGNIVTHPGAGAGGADVSMAAVESDLVSYAGSNVQLSGAGPHFRIADDFGIAESCVLSQVVTYGYQTGAATPTWTSVNLNIRAGSPTGTVVESATSTTWEWTGVYRVFNGLANLGNTQRPVHRIIFDFPDITLDPGTYWIDWQVVGGASGWAPYVMQGPEPPGSANTQTVYENGRQMFNAAGEWQPTLFPPGAEVPFLVRGPGAPPLSQHGTPVQPRPTRLAPDYHLQVNDRAQ